MSSIHRTEIRVPEDKWKKWNESARKAGVSLSAFIMIAVDEYMNPIHQKINSSQVEPENPIFEIKKELTMMRDELFEYDRQKAMFNVAQFGAPEVKIQDKILNALKQSSEKLTEFDIADIINEDKDITWVVLSFLKSIGKVNQNKDMGWYLSQAN